MVRLMAEGKEGRFTRNALIEALWEDADARSKKLGVGIVALACVTNSSKTRELNFICIV